MLNVLMYGTDEYDNGLLVKDVEAEYFSSDVADKISEKDNDIITFIDESKISNGELFDRFGNKLYPDTFSTGCKAALLVRYEPNKIINTVECGTNAIECILLNCKNGTILGYNPDSWEALDDGIKLNIKMFGKTLNSSDEVNAELDRYSDRNQ